jgi:hypothetical protein
MGAVGRIASPPAYALGEDEQVGVMHTPTCKGFKYP